MKTSFPLGIEIGNFSGAYNAMEGVGTSDTTLMRTVVTRAGIDMEDVKKEYALANKKSLKDAIHKDTLHFLSSASSSSPNGLACSGLGKEINCPAYV